MLSQSVSVTNPCAAVRELPSDAEHDTVTRMTRLPGGCCVVMVQPGLKPDANGCSRTRPYLPGLLGSDAYADPDSRGPRRAVPRLRHHPQQDEPQHLHDLRAQFPLR